MLERRERETAALLMAVGSSIASGVIYSEAQIDRAALLLAPKAQ